MPAVRRIRLADGRWVAYGEYGLREGHPLVFLHGFPGSRHAGALLDEAARRMSVRVVAPERPGIGFSSPRPGRNLVDYAGDLEQIADRLELGRFALVGESGGGPYALACAYALPGRLSCVSLVGALGPVGCPVATVGMAAGEQIGYAIARRAPIFSGYALALIALCGRRYPQAFLRLCESQFAGPDRQSLRRPEVAATFLRDFLEAFRQGGRRVGDELALLMRPWPFAARSIRAPVRFFHGELDRTVPVAVSRELAAVIPHARLHVYPDEGHLSMLVQHAEKILGVA